MPTFSETLSVVPEGFFPLLDISTNKVKGLGIFNSLDELYSLQVPFRSVGYLALVRDGDSAALYVHIGTAIEDWTVDDFTLVFESTQTIQTDQYYKWEVEGSVIPSYTWDPDSNAYGSNFDTNYYITTQFESEVAWPASSLTETQIAANTPSKKESWRAFWANNLFGVDPSTTFTKAKSKFTVSIGKSFYYGENQQDNIFPSFTQQELTEIIAGTWTAPSNIATNFAKIPATLLNDPEFVGFFPGETAAQPVYLAYKPWLNLGVGNPDSWAVISAPNVPVVQLGFTRATEVPVGTFSSSSPGDSFGPQQYSIGSAGLDVQDLTNLASTVAGLDSLFLCLHLSNSLAAYLQEWYEAYMDTGNTFNTPMPPIKYRGWIDVKF